LLEKMNICATDFPAGVSLPPENVSLGELL